MGGQEVGDAEARTTDAFIVKYNASGDFLWIKQLGELAEGSDLGLNATLRDDYIKSITTDASNNIYVAGHTKGDLGETSSGNTDIFIAKFNSSGNFEWINQLGAEAEGSTIEIGAAKENEYLTGIEVGPFGHIYVVGFTQGDLGETNGSEDEASSTSDALLIKFKPDGTLDPIN